MLEAVIKNKNLALQFLNGRVSQGHTVGPLQVRHVRQVLLQHQRLVIATTRTAVTSAEDGHTSIKIAIEASHILDARRLAGAAGGQVADADDRHRHALASQPAAVIRDVTQPHGRAIGQTSGAQNKPLKRRPEAARLARY